ncbi:hypothetical protein C463_10090 [Halorubrum californiense DSM 19288]|uniref:Uncharacterized protein n=1 Tax=Halorubrum californiense DSM 19288 TaxID=1227465 RepID=M0E582_9EURY|nr:MULTISPECIES: hypothetical protein [Halorubrum]ELZ42946.1 hypothetical protein C463_10090 [Halorubrum californiense DSM 19288]TKX68820.1 hypothetical protein EXE40_11955 [Halorubrum sp. GN11GM_10-3_MGM]
MTSLQSRLASLSDVDVDAAEQTRDAVLSELDVPSDWAVAEADVEIAQDGTRDWLLLVLEHASDREKRASVFLLADSHALQTYVEASDTDEWSEPTRDPSDLRLRSATARDSGRSRVA